MKILFPALRVINGLVGLVLGGLLGGLFAYLSVPLIDGFGPREAALIVGISGGAYLGLMMMWVALDVFNADI